MSAGYIEPVERSLARTKRMLFKPFRFDFWLVLGFAAFLGNLAEGPTSFQYRWPGNVKDDAGTIGQQAHDFLHEPYTLIMLGVVLSLLIVLGIVLTWVGARGRFVFLDDVLHERAAIVEPWKRFQRIGNSLFLFQLILGLGLLAFLLVVFGGFLKSVFLSVWQDGSFPNFDPWSLVISGMIAAPVWLGALILFVLTKHFVVPLMWKHDLGVVAAWKRFWPLLTSHPFWFIGFVLFLIPLAIVTFVAIAVAGLGTCCIGFCLMAIPYVGSVALLPVFVPWRALGPEFLAQFGPEWDVRPAAAPPEVPPNPAV